MALAEWILSSTSMLLLAVLLDSVMSTVAQCLL